MPFRGGYRIRPLGSSQESSCRGDDGMSAEVAHGLLRFVLWLLRADSDGLTAVPVRVYYKFESGCWRSSSTRQLQRVYRCR